MSQLTTSEMRQYEEIITIFNRSNLGKHDKLEFDQILAFMKSLDVTLEEEEVRTIFDKLDGNFGDGAISMSEFLKYLLQDDKAQENNLGHPLRALSVFYLEVGLLREVAAVGLTPDARIYELEAPLIRAKGADMECPRDGQTGAAFVDAVHGCENVGLATHMLSYTWGYTVACIVSSLSAWCRRGELRPESTYIWMCCVCINQHRVQEARRLGCTVPFEDFSCSFGGRVRSISKVIALMEPWRAPRYCQRAWCVFELHTAAELDADCDLELIMPPDEVDSFATAIAEGNGLLELWHTLADTKLEEAKASVSQDRENIFKLVEQGPGFKQLNETIVQKLQTWFAQAAYEHVLGWLRSDRTITVARACRRVAEFFRMLGKFDRAGELLDAGLGVLADCAARETPEHAALLGSVGHLKREQGDLDGAMAQLTEARRILVAAAALNTPDGAETLSSMGSVLIEQRDFDGALYYLMEARQVREATCTLETLEGQSILQMLGHMRREKQDFDGALANYAEAQSVLWNSHAVETPQGAALKASIGHVKRLRGDLEGALESYAEARQIFEVLQTLQTPNGGSLLVNVGHVLRAKGDLDGALLSYQEARSLFKASGSWETPAAKECKRLIGMLSM